MKSEVNFFVGLLWGSLFSMILWMAFFILSKEIMSTVTF
ncbi:hypothetical protein BTGOE1_35640 [Bacillus thuringiensis]|nr:hypothetical protein BTGOE1_35640 [Bacillus thuringiensis]OFC84862.1 hypothetical protein BTGOE2_10590 [Bacillus thuringiensis]